MFGAACRDTSARSGVIYLVTRSSEPDRPRWSGLDGLRALAVMAVVAYHFLPAAVPGGFLGVDVFFVLSGYLITRMIATEYLDTGRFRFGDFYRRRARRLLPGVAVVLIATLAAAAFWRDQLSTVRGATAAAATYVSNWWLSFAHQSYFVSAGRPSMLQHLWSLAVEEQFYLLWPLIAVGILALVGPGHGARATAAQRSRYLALAATGLALASAGEMAALALAHNAPYGADASRLYYGTDTHSMGLLLGAALGALAAGRSRADAERPLARKLPHRVFGRMVWLTDAVAVLALIALVLAQFAVHEQSPVLYRGGFLAVAAIAALAVAGVARPGSRVGAAIDRRPLRWLAARSYAIYLWHWPVATVTRPGIDVHWPGPVVLAVRTAATLLLADLTYRAVEAPVRRLGLRTSIRHGVGRLSRVVVGQAPVGARLATAALVGAVLLAGGVLAAGPAPTLSAAQKALAAERGGRDLPLGHAAPATPASSPVDSINERLGTDAPSRTPATRSAPASTHPAARPAHAAGRLPAISAFGDSVMLGARHMLDAHFPGGTMDAVEGRQADPILRDIEREAVSGRLNPLVVIGVGDNGLINPDSLTRTMQRLRTVKHVIVLNNRVGRFWQDANNRTLARIVPHFANATLLDWHSLAGRHPAWLYDDGIHLTPRGAVAYTELIVSAARRNR